MNENFVIPKNAMSKVKEYFDKGVIKDLVDVGFVSPSKLNYPVYVRQVTEYMEKGMSKTQAVIETSIKCKVCESTIWKSIRIIQ